MNKRQSRIWGVFALGVSAAALSLAGAAPTQASPVYSYLTSIPIPGAAVFSSYDLSVFDTSNQLYYLTDRSNKGIDVVSAASDTFVARIGAGQFVGAAGGNTDIAGPNGISLSNTSAGKLLIAGNGASNFLTFNLDPTGLNVVGAPRTTSTAVAGTPTSPNRVDGVAYAPGANTILAANNASNPGFLTLVDNASGAVIRSIPLDGTGGFPSVAANGVEATTYSKSRDAYFVAVPTLGTDAAGNPTDSGGVIQLDPQTGNLLHTFDFNALGLTGACSPTGLSEGNNGTLFVACSDPAAGRSVLLDPNANGGQGSLRYATGISGGDQTGYDTSRNVFFEAARFQPGGSVLGIIDGATLAVQTIPIGAGDHAVAADPVSGKVFVATGPTDVIPGCVGGCIGVFTPVPEPASLTLLGVGLVGFGLTRRKRA